VKYWVGLLVVVCAVQGALGYGLHRYHLTLNVGHSLAGSLYACRALGAAEVLHQGDIVYYVPPDRVRETIRQVAPQADLRLGWLKQVAATGGDQVCWEGGQLLLNQQGRGKLHLLHEYALPIASGCQVLREGDVLTMGTAERSFDGRYFGPVTRREIQDVCTVLF
jgi:type IV secretory pathway protease TraF